MKRTEPSGRTPLCCSSKLPAGFRGSDILHSTERPCGPALHRTHKKLDVLHIKLSHLYSTLFTPKLETVQPTRISSDVLYHITQLQMLYHTYYGLRRVGMLRDSGRQFCRATATTSSSAIATKVRTRNAVFKFKHFDLNHGKCAQKMGTDSMLLGSWAEPPSDSKTVLDIGTGTGVLALMMAQKTQQQYSLVHAIDIDRDSYIQAAENFQQAPWSERLHAAHASLQDWVSNCRIKYDLIITNPPYFLQSSKPGKSARAAARHADVQLPFPELASSAAQLLQPTGRLCLILPALEAQQFAVEAQQHGLQLTRVLKVFTKCQDAHPKRLVMQFEFTDTDLSSKAGTSTRMQGSPPAAAEEQLVVMQQTVDPVTQNTVHVYSKQYQLLTVDFHHPSMFQKES